MCIWPWLGQSHSTNRQKMSSRQTSMIYCCWRLHSQSQGCWRCYLKSPCRIRRTLGAKLSTFYIFLRVLTVEASKVSVLKFIYTCIVRKQVAKFRSPIGYSANFHCSQHFKYHQHFHFCSDSAHTKTFVLQKIYQFVILC